jgi:hypothetical protein
MRIIIVADIKLSPIRSRIYLRRLTFRQLNSCSPAADRTLSNFIPYCLNIQTVPVSKSLFKVVP